MGPYLSQPNQDKITTTGQGNSVIFAASEMQGWRNTMEDAHIHKLDIIKDVSVFGVFDGHGGREVAQFVQKNFIDELLKNKNFQNQQFEDALKETFLRMDELLMTPTGQKELNNYKANESNSDYQSKQQILLLDVLQMLLQYTRTSYMLQMQEIQDQYYVEIIQTLI